MTVYATGRKLDHWVSALEADATLGAARFHVVDMQDHAELMRFSDRVAQSEGRIDVLVNNAGIMEAGTTHLMPPEDVSRQLDVLLHGPIILTQAVLTHMVARGSGHVISVASAAAMLPSPRLAVYSAAKAGLIQFTRSIAAEYGLQGIRANVIAPGVVETDLASRHLLAALARSSPLGRMARPDEVAGLVSYLLGPDGAYVTGSVLTIDGGLGLTTSSPATSSAPAVPAPTSPGETPVRKKAAVDARELPRLARVFAKALQCTPEEVTVDTTPDDIERWDSLGHVRLAQILEAEFAIRLEVDEVMEMTSVRAILALIARKTAPGR
jgi:NAD(P)-dependent dehydrogenase (short-subunit alcohol dehydrogenase family)/acyl carrier protein